METSWPPAYDNAVAAPAGEPATASWTPSQSQLDWTHRALQVTFMGLALIGLLILFTTIGPSAVLRGAARKHAVQS